MPKRILASIVFLSALALAACGGSGSGLSTPTPAPTATPTPNQTLTTALITVNASGTPVPNQPVLLSTPDPNGRPGAVIATQNTNTSGQTTFTALTPAATYCFQATYNATPPPSPAPTPLPQTKSYCVNYWAGGLTFNF